MMPRQFLPALLLSAAAYGQPASLHVEATTPVFGIQGGINMGAVRCDTDGNVYFRTYVAEQVLAAPVVKIVPDGTKYVSFDVGPWKEDPNARPQVRDFTLGESELSLLTQNENPPVQIIHFDLDGRYKSVSNLDAPWDPVRVAALGEGGLLVFGTRTVTNARKKPSLVPVAAIFDLSGKFLRDVKLPFAVEGQGDDPSAATLEAMRRMLIDSGPSGVYLLPPTAPASLMVFSPAGEFTRKLDLPSPGAGFLPASLHVTAEQVIVEYARPVKGQGDQTRYALYEPATGRLIASYDGAGVSGNLACYDHSGTFIFLSVRDSQRVLVKARP